MARRYTLFFLVLALLLGVALASDSSTDSDSGESDSNEDVPVASPVAKPAAVPEAKAAKAPAKPETPASTAPPKIVSAPVVKKDMKVESGSATAPKATAEAKPAATESKTSATSEEKTTPAPAATTATQQQLEAAKKLQAKTEKKLHETISSSAKAVLAEKERQLLAMKAEMEKAQASFKAAEKKAEEQKKTLESKAQSVAKAVEAHQKATDQKQAEKLKAVVDTAKAAHAKEAATTVALVKSKAEAEKKAKQLATTVATDNKAIEKFKKDLKRGVEIAQDERKMWKKSVKIAEGLRGKERRFNKRQILRLKNGLIDIIAKSKTVFHSIRWEIQSAVTDICLKNKRVCATVTKLHATSVLRAIIRSLKSSKSLDKMLKEILPQTGFTSLRRLLTRRFGRNGPISRFIRRRVASLTKRLKTKLDKDFSVSKLSLSRFRDKIKTKIKKYIKTKFGSKSAKKLIAKTKSNLKKNASKWKKRENKKIVKTARRTARRSHRRIHRMIKRLFGKREKIDKYIASESKYIGKNVFKQIKKIKQVNRIINKSAKVFKRRLVSRILPSKDATKKAILTNLTRDHISRLRYRLHAKFGASTRLMKFVERRLNTANKRVSKLFGTRASLRFFINKRVKQFKRRIWRTIPKHLWSASKKHVKVPHKKVKPRLGRLTKKFWRNTHVRKLVKKVALLQVHRSLRHALLKFFAKKRNVRHMLRRRPFVGVNVTEDLFVDNDNAQVKILAQIQKSVLDFLNHDGAVRYKLVNTEHKLPAALEGFRDTVAWIMTKRKFKRYMRKLVMRTFSQKGAIERLVGLKEFSDDLAIIAKTFGKKRLILGLKVALKRYVKPLYHIRRLLRHTVNQLRTRISKPKKDYHLAATKAMITKVVKNTTKKIISNIGDDAEAEISDEAREDMAHVLGPVSHGPIHITVHTTKDPSIKALLSSQMMSLPELHQNLNQVHTIENEWGSGEAVNGLRKIIAHLDSRPDFHTDLSNIPISLHSHEGAMRIASMLQDKIDILNKLHAMKRAKSDLVFQRYWHLLQQKYALGNHASELMRKRSLLKLKQIIQLMQHKEETEAELKQLRDHRDLMNIEHDAAALEERHKMYAQQLKNKMKLMAANKKYQYLMWLLKEHRRDELLQSISRLQKLTNLRHIAKAKAQVHYLEKKKALMHHMIKLHRERIARINKLNESRRVQREKLMKVHAKLLREKRHILSDLHHWRVLKQRNKYLLRLNVKEKLAEKKRLRERAIREKERVDRRMMMLAQWQLGNYHEYLHQTVANHAVAAHLPIIADDEEEEADAGLD